MSDVTIRMCSYYQEGFGYCQLREHVHDYHVYGPGSPKLYTEVELDSAIQAAHTEMSNQFWEQAALRGVPAGKYTPAELVIAIEQIVRAELNELIEEAVDYAVTLENQKNVGAFNDLKATLDTTLAGERKV